MGARAGDSGRAQGSLARGQLVATTATAEGMWIEATQEKEPKRQNASEAAGRGGCKSRGFPVRPVNQRESSLRDASGLTFIEDSSRWRAIACRAAFSRLTISRFLAASSRLPTIRCALPRW